MTYVLEQSKAEHLGVLTETLQGWTKEPHDIILVSQDGSKVFSQKLILSLHSPLIDTVLGETKDVCPSVSVGATTVTITALLDLLVYGKTTANEDHFEEVLELAESLGINVANSEMEDLMAKTKKVNKDNSFLAGSFMTDSKLESMNKIEQSIKVKK